METDKLKQGNQVKETQAQDNALGTGFDSQKTPISPPPLTQNLTAGPAQNEHNGEQQEGEYEPETVVFEIGGFASPENPKDTGGKGIKIVMPPNLNAEQALVRAMMAMLRVSEAEAKIAIEKENMHWENYNPEGHGTDREGNVIHLLRFKEKYAVRTAHEPEKLHPESEKGKTTFYAFKKFLADRKDQESEDLGLLFDAFAKTVPELVELLKAEDRGDLPKNAFDLSYKQRKSEVLEFATWDRMREKREGLAAGIEGEKTALKPTVRAMADQFGSVPIDLLKQYVPARFYTKWTQLHVQVILAEADLDSENPAPIDKALVDGIYQLGHHFALYAEAKLGTTSSSYQTQYSKFGLKDVQTLIALKSAEKLGPNEAQLLLYSYYKLSFSLFEAFGKDIANQSESTILSPNGDKDDNLKGQQMQNAGATGKAVLDLTATRPNAQRINAKFLPEKVVSKFGKDDKSQDEGIELQLYLWHDEAEGEWVLEDFSNVESFKNNRVEGAADAPVPTELFANLNSKLRFPKGAVYYRIPSEASYRILRTNEPMEWQDWLRFAAMAGVAVGMALSTAGASIPATVTMIAASGAFAAADGIEMAEKSSHGMLKTHDIALHTASMLACVVSAGGASMRLGMMAENALLGIEGYSASQISQIRIVAGVQLAADVPCLALFTGDAFAQLKAATEQDKDGSGTFERVLGFLLQMGMQGVMLVGMHHSMMEAAGGNVNLNGTNSAKPKASEIRSSLLKRMGLEEGFEIKFTDVELETFFAYASGQGFTSREIDAMMMSKVRLDATYKNWSIPLGMMQEVAQTLAVKSKNHNIAFKKGWDFMRAYTVAQERMTHGGVLEPSVYLEASFVEQQLSSFKGKSSYLLTGESYREFVLDKEFLGRADAVYISPASKIDEVLAKANGDIAIVEKELGIGAGDWQNKRGLYRVDLSFPEREGMDLRLPNGSEAASNVFWNPGGYTSGGVPEAVVNQIPNTKNFVDINPVIQ